MSIQRKSGTQIYKNVKFEYSVYGESNIFSGDAFITVDVGSYIAQPILVLDKKYQTINEAETAIINTAKNWIDNNLN